MPHIHKDIDLTVVVYIVHKNKVLLCFHKKLGAWLPIGGHVELNEDAEEALFREILEECGLKVKLLVAPLPVVPDAQFTKFLPVPSYFDIHSITMDHRHMNLIYFGVSESNETKLAEAEHDSLRWFSAEELDNPEFNVWPTIKFYAKEALKRATSQGQE